VQEIGRAGRSGALALAALRYRLSQTFFFQRFACNDPNVADVRTVSRWVLGMSCMRQAVTATFSTPELEHAAPKFAYLTRNGEIVVDVPEFIVDPAASQAKVAQAAAAGAASPLPRLRIDALPPCLSSRDSEEYAACCNIGVWQHSVDNVNPARTACTISVLHGDCSRFQVPAVATADGRGWRLDGATQHSTRASVHDAWTPRAPVASYPSLPPALNGSHQRLFDLITRRVPMPTV
jgi:hypothetical protein